MSLTASAQQNSWSVNNESRNNIATDKAVARLSFPKEFKLFNLNIEPLRQQLFSIVGSDALQRSTVIFLPNADGEYEQFEVFEASNFEPDLQARFPEIRAYSGKGITDKYATLKLSISPQGIQTMVFRTDKENEFIEPYSHDHTVYAVYKSHRERGRLPWTCFTEDKQAAADIDSQLPHGPLSNTGELKTMRLAQSCNGEYSNFFGAFNSSQSAFGFMPLLTQRLPVVMVVTKETWPYTSTLYANAFDRSDHIITIRQQILIQHWANWNARIAESFNSMWSVTQIMISATCLALPAVVETPVVSVAFV